MGEKAIELLTLVLTLGSLCRQEKPGKTLGEKCAPGLGRFSEALEGGQEE